MAGRYKFTVRNSEGHITKETDWFENLITNNGLDLIWTSPSFAFGIKSFNPYCVVGTGSTPPTFTDATLQAYLAIGTAVAEVPYAYVAGPPPYWEHGAVYRFGTGVAAGNLSEVGVGWGNTNLFSRALIKDAFGVPTTITVLSDEVLDVTYVLRVYPPTTDVVVPFTLNGAAITVTARTLAIQVPIRIYNAMQAEGANTSMSYPYPGVTGDTLHDIYGTGGNFASYGGSGYAATGKSYLPYVIGSYYLDGNAYWPLDRAVGQNQLWQLEWQQGRTQFKLSTAAVKTNFQQMTMSWRVSWGRYP